NAVQVFFTDGTKTDRIEIHFPVGHRRRRNEGIPLLQQKATAAFAAHYGNSRGTDLAARFADRWSLESLPVRELVAQFTA
ncbi:MAG: 2-methylcitrate dehydratase, partial [Verrucomicrobiota bacterium]